MGNQLLRLPERFQVALQKAAAEKVQAAAAEKLQASTDGSTTPADQIQDITNRRLTADAAKIKAGPPPPTVTEPKTSVIQTGAVHSFTLLLSSPCSRFVKEEYLVLNCVDEDPY